METDLTHERQQAHALLDMLPERKAHRRAQTCSK